MAAKGNNIRIMHSGDIHLDTPFSKLGREKSEIRRAELRAAFTSMTQYARSASVDFFLMPGDLFDSGYASGETADIMISEFEKTPSCRFIISPGNHDPYMYGSIYEARKFPDNVHIFSDGKLSCISFPDKGVDVYGWAFTSETKTDNPLLGHRVAEPGRINLLCAHADIKSPLSSYCPVSTADILNFGADYTALGHIHKSDGIICSGGCCYGYSGCPEGRSFDEPGEGGAYFAEIQTDGSRKKIDVRKEKFSHRSYETEHIDITGACSAADVREALRKRIALKKFTQETILRVYFEGMTSPSLPALSQLTENWQGLFSLSVEDDTVPVFDTDALMKDMTIRGAFFRKMLPLTENGDEGARAIAAAALKCGLAALSGGDITGI